MSNLISAGLIRLRKSRVFYACVAVMTFLALINIYSSYNEQFKYDSAVKLENVVFSFVMLESFVIAAFCALFTGSEYSDRTLHNKLIVGHGRAAIYLSNLTVNIFAAVIMCALYAAVAFALGAPLFGLMKISASGLLLKILGIFMLICVYCAIFTAVSMLCSSKALSSIICIISVVVMFISALMLYNRISAPEYYDGISISQTDGESNVYTNEKIENPRHITGMTRQIYETAFDILPAGQAYQYSDGDYSSAKLTLPLWSLALTVLFSTAGIFIFERKDIK